MLIQYIPVLLFILQCEPQDYEEVVKHLYEILYKAEITKERLLVFTQRLINDVAQVSIENEKKCTSLLQYPTFLP